jgi:hypothetical protein
MNTFERWPHGFVSRRSFVSLSLRSFAGLLATRAMALHAVERAFPPADGKLRIILFGAYPDDCEIAGGGTAAKWAALGHHGRKPNQNELKKLFPFFGQSGR